MKQFTQEFSCGGADLRVDVRGSHPVENVLEDTTYLMYRLASVQIKNEPKCSAPHIIWNQDASPKNICLQDDVLILDGEWFEGELQKILVSMLALKMESIGLHPFHASAVRYNGRTVMFIQGESNHGKTMSQIEGSRRGGLLISTETTVTDERGWALLGSKNVFLRKRAKGVERADKPNQDAGIAKFFDKTPEFINYDEPSNVDMVIVPAIDGHFDTEVTFLEQFEKEYQTYFSLMNFLLVSLLLDTRLPMPDVDTEVLRLRRADFCHRFAERPYYIIRAKTPQVVWDELERLW
jgi:hypothetical protein